MRLLAAAAVLLALIVPATAAAGHGTPPWAGGYETVSPLEARASQIVSTISGRTATAYCNDESQWAGLGLRFGFAPGAVAGFVMSYGGISSDYTQLAPTTCFRADEFMGNPQRIGQKICQTGTRVEYRDEQRTEMRTETRTEYRTEARTEYRLETRTTTTTVIVKKRVKRKGKWVVVKTPEKRTKREQVRVPYTVDVQVPYSVEVQVAVTVTVRVPYNAPVYADCAGYLSTLDSVQTIAHEAVHVAGIQDEAVAECYGVQLLPYAVFVLGAPADFAYEAGRDYLPRYAQIEHVYPEYWSSECRDGGALDLYPTRQGWPAPEGGYLARPALPQALGVKAAAPSPVAVLVDLSSAEPIRTP